MIWLAYSMASRRSATKLDSLTVPKVFKLSYKRLGTVTAASWLATSPLASPPIPSATMKREPSGPTSWSRSEGDTPTLSCRKIANHVIVLVVLADPPHVGHPAGRHVDGLRIRNHCFGHDSHPPPVAVTPNPGPGETPLTSE